MRRVTGLVVVMLWVGAPAFAQDAGDINKPPVIVTHGQASLKRAPDQAWVSIAAESRAGAPAEAQRLNAEAMQAVNAALARAGIAADAIRTTGYSLQPEMEYVNGRGRVKGYIARNQVEARVDDLKKLGAVLDAAGTSGATSMAGLRFDITDRATVEREALRLAVLDAMARARAIASGAGATLGPLVRIDEQSEQGSPGIYMAMRAESASAAQTPVSPGELEIRAQVMLTVSIK
jgi:hypothetical protein